MVVQPPLQPVVEVGVGARQSQGALPVIGAQAHAAAGKLQALGSRRLARAGQPAEGGQDRHTSRPTAGCITDGTVGCRGGSGPAEAARVDDPIGFAPVGKRRMERLDPGLVHATVVRLADRIRARFPERHLGHVADELVTIAKKIDHEGDGARRRLHRVTYAARLGSVLILAATSILLLLAVRDAIRHGPDTTIEWVPLIESMINDLVFAGIALFFLRAWPERIERGRLLATLHRLRSLAHIVDMHQLTKDPERLRPDFVPTSHSVDPGLGRDDLEHYLDYCSELLSLIGKVAALCAEESEDALVLDTISTIETMTTGMSGKIWQKISLLPN